MTVGLYVGGHDNVNVCYFFSNLILQVKKKGEETEKLSAAELQLRIAIKLAK